MEALTIVLAVGAVRGWRNALAGAGAAVLLLLLLVVLLGPAIARIPQHWVQLVMGALLLAFGLRWLRKAILRAAGRLPLRDEAAAFVRHSATLAARPKASGWNRAGLATAFQITMVEGIEVVFIVIATGAGGLLWPASLGALAALIVVVALGVALHRPLASVPENKLKFAVAVLLCAFGAFWLGEGLGLAWPGGDLSLVGLNLACLLAALALVRRLAAVSRS